MYYDPRSVIALCAKCGEVFGCIVKANIVRDCVSCDLVGKPECTINQWIEFLAKQNKKEKVEYQDQVVEEKVEMCSRCQDEHRALLDLLAVQDLEASTSP